LTDKSISNKIKIKKKLEVTLAKTILVVDDDTMIRSLLNEFLTGLGFNVIEAADGKEGLDIFKRESIDLVISDIRMPGMSGMDLLKWIKSISPKTSVLMITGYRPSRAQEDAMSTKADGYLIKPFELERLKLTIRQFLH
jgi:DNA-binding NtrC family response regulator